MTTDVLERPDAAADDEDRVFVTLTVAEQLCGIPCWGCATSSASKRSPASRWRRRRSPGSLNLRGRIVTAIDLRRRLKLPPRARRPARRMSVVAEQGGELYALLVDQVSEVMSLKAAPSSAIRRPCRPTWAQFSSGIYRLEDRLAGGAGCRAAAGADRSRLRRGDVSHLPRRR